MDLLIPYALDGAGRWVSPAVAGGLPGPWSCPECRQRVVRVRDHMARGSPRQTHFRHVVASDCAATAESVLHRWAADMICEQARRAAASEERWPNIIHRCERCSTRRTLGIPGMGSVRDAAREFRLDSGRVADVALLDAAGVPVFVVEVYVTHPVDDEKRADLLVPWCEIEALVYEQERAPWDARQIGFAVDPCRRCAELRRQRLEHERLRREQEEARRRTEQAAAEAEKQRLAHIAAEREADRVEWAKRDKERREAWARAEPQRAAEQASREAATQAEREQKLAAAKEREADTNRRWLLNYLRPGSSTTPYTTAEVLAEFKRRGASIRYSDQCIFTSVMGMNDAEFSYRTLAWLRAGGDIRLLKKTREIER